MNDLDRAGRIFRGDRLALEGYMDVGLGEGNAGNLPQARNRKLQNISRTQGQLNEVLATLRPMQNGTQYKERFILRDGTKDVLVHVGEIEWIEAADYYSCLHAGGRKYMLRETIKQLVELLDPSRFVRIHRSVMVRIDQVREIHRDGEAEYFVVLTGGQRLKMSKAGWKNLVTANEAR